MSLSLPCLTTNIDSPHFEGRELSSCIPEWEKNIRIFRHIRCLGIWAMMKARLYLYIMGKYKALQIEALAMFSQRPPASQSPGAGILHFNTQHQKSGHLGWPRYHHFAAVLNKNSSKARLLKKQTKEYLDGSAQIPSRKVISYRDW